MAHPNNPDVTKLKFQLSLDYRLLCAVLLVVIVGMIAWWQPWNDPRASDRVITVTGSATVKAEPDLFVFYPSYQFENANKQAALAELTKKNEEFVSKLKELGVADSDIKTNADGNSISFYYEEKSNPTYSLRLTVTVDNKELAQKVQDYLITTSPLGSVSPQATFSNDKQTDLENQARDEATKNARSKAEQSAKNLGFSLGSVKTVDDAAGFGIGYAQPMAEDTIRSSELKLTVQPGENELSYSVTVTYFVR